MKRLIVLSSVMILIGLSYGLAGAAAPTSNVIVVNTSSNPVPVTGISETTTQLLSTTFVQIPADGTQFLATNLDVSKCSSLRFSAVVQSPAPFILPSPPACGITDTASGANIATAQLTNVPFSATGTPQSSILVQTPARSISVYCFNPDTATTVTVNAVLHCR